MNENVMDGNIVETLRKDLGLESTINNIKAEILIQNSLRWNSSDPKITEWAERMHCTLRLEAAKNHLLCECALSKQEEAVEASIEELLNRPTKAEVRKGAQILSLVADRITTFSGELPRPSLTLRGRSFLLLNMKSSLSRDFLQRRLLYF